jgi:hypothetical protein
MDLSVTNTWLAVGAISLLVIAIAVVAALVVLMRAAQAVTDSAARASTAIEHVSQQVSPLAAQTSAFLGDVHELVLHIRRADDVTSAAVGHIADRWRRVNALARSSLWPALAVARGASAVVQWIAGRNPRGAASGTAGKDDLDRSAESRFTYEGGSIPARSAGR